MKNNPAVPGGSLTSKPTWSNTSGCSATSAFFVLRRFTTVTQAERRNRITKHYVAKLSTHPEGETRWMPVEFLSVNLLSHKEKT